MITISKLAFKKKKKKLTTQDQVDRYVQYDLCVYYRKYLIEFISVAAFWHISHLRQTSLSKRKKQCGGDFLNIEKLCMNCKRLFTFVI